MRTRYVHGGITHRLGYCQECAWEEDGYKDTLKDAHKHAAETGHTVSIETGTRGNVRPT